MYSIRLLKSDYPTIYNRIKMLWGSPECRKYLLEITLKDSHDDSHFSVVIMQALHFLISRHDNEFPDLIPTTVNYNR